MAEELKITVVDGGGSAGGGASRPGGPGGTVGGSAASGGTSSAEGALRSGIGSAAGVGSALAAGNVAGAVSSTASAALGVLVGPIGIAAAAVATSLGVATIAVKSFASTVKTQVDLLAGFSAEVATAQANTQLAIEMSLLRRGARIGPELARAEQLRSRFEGALTDINTEILRVLLRIFELLEPVLDPILTALESVADNFNATLGGLEAALRNMGQFFLASLIGELRKLIPEEDPADVEIDQDPFFGLFDNTGRQNRVATENAGPFNPNSPQFGGGGGFGQ